MKTKIYKIILLFVAYLVFSGVASADLIVIKDNSTGGDCSLASTTAGLPIGVWDASTKTCTLSSDISPDTVGRSDMALIIDSNNVTLDGAGHSISGQCFTGGDAWAVAVSGGSGNTVKNISVSTCGVLVLSATQTTLDHVIVPDSSMAIKISQSPYTTIVNSEMKNASTGLYVVSGSDHLTMRNNSFENNRQSNLDIASGEFDGKLGNDIDTTNLIEGRPIYYFENANDRVFDSLQNPSQFYCINCSNITLSNSVFDAVQNKDDIILYRVASSTIINNTIKSNMGIGVSLMYAPNATFLNNKISDNGTGINIYSSPNSVIKNNAFLNQVTSIAIGYGSSNVLIQNNDFTGGYWTIGNSGEIATIIQNNFFGGYRDLDSYGASPTFSEDLPVGGNYYASYDSPSEGCVDANADGVCDSPHNLIKTWNGYPDTVLATDYFPWTTPNGWLNYAPQAPPSNVLFLPGVEASRLYRGARPDEQSQTGEVRLWEPLSDQNVKDMFLDENGKAISPLLPEYKIYTRDVLDEAYLTDAGPNIYKSFLAELEKMKSDKTIVDYSAVPYDWRLSLDDILNSGTKDGDKIYYDGPTITPYIESELNRLASTSPSGKVTIIAHSNGGLVAKALLKKLQDAGDPLAQKIDKIIFVAVPQIGTPEAIATMLNGHRGGLPSEFPLDKFLSEATAREFAHNLPSAYNLLPSANYFTYVDTPVVSFDSSVSDWADKYGKVIHWQGGLHNFLTDNYGRASMSSTDTKKPVALSDALLTQAEKVHDNLDKWTPPSGVKVYQIAGWGVPDTMSGIMYDKTLCLRISCGFMSKTITPEPTWTVDGDGTVVTPSALWMNNQGETRWWVNLRKFNNDNPFFTIGQVKHKNIIEIPELLKFIENIITNKSLDVLPQYISSTTPIADANDTRLIYALRAPENISFNMYDNKGNHTGISTTTQQIIGGQAVDTVDENIPDTYMTSFSDVTYIFTNTGTTGRIIITNNSQTAGGNNNQGSGEATTPFVFSIQEVQNGTLVASTTVEYLKDEPIIQASVDVMGDIGTIPPIQVDTNGDGQPDETIVPQIDDVVVVSNPSQPKPDPDNSGQNQNQTGTTTPTDISTTTPEQTGGQSDSQSGSGTQPDNSVQVTGSISFGNGPVSAPSGSILGNFDLKVEPLVSDSVSESQGPTLDSILKVGPLNSDSAPKIITLSFSSSSISVSDGQTSVSASTSQLAQAISAKSNLPISKTVIYFVAILILVAILYLTKFIIK